MKLMFILRKEILRGILGLTCEVALLSSGRRDAIYSIANSLEADRGHVKPGVVSGDVAGQVHD